MDPKTKIFLNMRSHGLVVVKADGSQLRGCGFEPRLQKTRLMLCCLFHPPVTLE